MDRETGPDVEQTGDAEQTGNIEPTMEFGQTGDIEQTREFERTGDIETASTIERAGAPRPAKAALKATAVLAPAVRPALAAASADPRTPVWIRRTLIAAAVGIAVMIWKGWPLGLTFAALVGIVDTVYQSKRMAVIPAAARVTAAQRRTRRRLALLRANGYVALHARAIPGSDSVIDHLVIGPAGVFAVDSEYWDRRLPVRASGGKILYHGPVNKKERLVHARWEAAQASLLVGAALGHPLAVRPVMVIYGPTIPWAVASLRGVDVFSGKWVRKYLRRKSRATRRRHLTGPQISHIYEAAAEVLPPCGKTASSGQVFRTATL